MFILDQQLLKRHVVSNAKLYKTVLSRQLILSTKPTASIRKQNDQIVNKCLSTKALEILENIPQNQDSNEGYFDKMLKQSLLEEDFFDVHKLVNLQDMFDNRVYLGHKEGTLNQYMKPYLFGSRLGHLIIDLEQSVPLLKDALNFTAHIAFRNGIILFINKSTTVFYIENFTLKKIKTFIFRLGTL